MADSTSAKDGRATNRLRVQVLSSVVDLLCPSTDEYDILRAMWARCVVESSGQDDTAVEELEARADTGTRLVSQLTYRAIDKLIGERTLLHAAGISDADGSVIALVGKSGSGKSTAVATLCKQQFGYVTDEVVAIDDRGSVLPFPRPVAMLRDGRLGGRKSLFGPDALGLLEASTPLTIGKIVLLERNASMREPARLEPVPLLSALLELIPQSSGLPSLDAPLAALCRVIASTGGARRLVFSEIAAAGTLLSELLTSPGEASVDWHQPVLEAAGPIWGLMDGRIRRRPVKDAVVAEDEALLLVDRTPVKVRGIGLTVWMSAARAPRMSELVDMVVAQHGPHLEAGRLVREAVRSLVDAEVLGYFHPIRGSRLLGGEFTGPAGGVGAYEGSDGPRASPVTSSMPG